LYALYITICQVIDGEGWVFCISQEIGWEDYPK